MANIEDSNKNPKQPDTEWVQPTDGVFETYCNTVHPSWTLYDVRIQYGQLVPLKAKTGPFVVEERAAITMTWQQIKILHGMLGALLESFEKTNGEIQPLILPPVPGSGL